MIDWTTKLGESALARLNSDIGVWLTAVDDHGVAQPNPVWFIWENDALLIYSIPTSKHMGYITARPRVTLHFNGNAEYEDLVIMTGDTVLDPSAPPAHQHTVYMKKYAEGIATLKMTPEEFAASYSAAFRIRPRTLRGF